MIYGFDHPHADRETATRLVGGKGASLWAMTRLGLPVPPGFTIGIGAQPAAAEVDAALARLEAAVGRGLADAAAPLLLSVRSGAVQSMPGMMDTVLNLGLTPAMVAAGGAFERAAWARFVSGMGDVEAAVLAEPRRALAAAIHAVQASWHSERARAYRAHAGLGDGGGTAVTVQAMVFGNRDARSATGVAFSRCPTTGALGPRGDVLFEAQGEEVVNGSRATLPLAALSERLPAVAAELLAAIRMLEVHYRDLVDVEFTIESGKLWVLQARTGKRSAAAAARIAVELTEDAEIGLARAEALARVPAEARPRLTRAAGVAPLAVGLAASPGLASGRIAMSCDAAIELAEGGEAVILVRAETSPEDVHGMGVSAGILTTLGGPMSHAALVAREWGLPAVVGATGVGLTGEGVRMGGRLFAPGEVISVDGSTGEVFAGVVAGEVIEDPWSATLRGWREGEAA
ncbi:PEP/pyruvate-binding domain-containing protein [Sandaracinobacteroides saxicola]|uniref:Pyruvate, phosphate dikinase n=1 Tax=Sandaracinobacteroides saxicola TaxID=2759707 RepID=A0A7G5IJI3_9SPHN|nr:PEP/pyruvate-binding domain-containing protein [Sandaracinobacteroides saxicola]QMW23525.1 hypothetical protein H3309_03225 [Sandaracinobacteroides saxicola]